MQVARLSATSLVAAFLDGSEEVGTAGLPSSGSGATGGPVVSEDGW